MTSLDDKVSQPAELEPELGNAGFIFFIAAAVIFLGGGLLAVASIVL